MLSHELYAATGIRDSKMTVSRRLNERGLFVRRPIVRVPLSPTNRRVHLKWCRDHRNWSTDQWATFLFTDESRFSLTKDSHLSFIQKKPGTRYLPSNVREIDHYNSRGLMVWTGITLDGRQHLRVFQRYTVSAVMYRDEALEPYILFFRGAVGPDFILIDNNMRSHGTHLVKEFLESVDIRRIDLPARSPDLNPLEQCL
ncbi:transposable element Tcb2 transposase [Trichonephila clavipes]|nr:transposable element Tcb2 transposase [Trichonephila clavipes]